MAMRFSRVLGLAAAAFFVAGALFLVAGPKVSLGEGVNYRVKVVNPADINAYVRVRASRGLCLAAGEKLLEPMESYTFDCGKWCPCGLEGEYYDRTTKTWKEMPPTNIDGSEKEGLFWVRGCESAVFVIHPAEGGGYGFLRR